MSCTVAYTVSPVPPQRPLIFADLIWPCGQIHYLTRRKAPSGEKRRMAYLERRFRSRKLGVPFARPCRRDEAGNEYGKSTLCRWQQATPSTGAWTSILHSGAQNSSTLPGWPCAMSHRGQAAGCCLWGRFWRCLVPRKSAPLTKWTSHGVCHPRLSGSSADSVVQRSKPDERMNGGRGWEWRQWCISTGATLANRLDPIASLTFLSPLRQPVIF